MSGRRHGEPRRIIYDGAPGTVWQNTTGKVLYQFIPALINTCGLCLQYINQISSLWPIPLHFGCRCEQRAILPGADASEPFVDFRDLLDNMSDADKRAAIGASNYRLLKAGVASWEDIVTPTRVRDLREVVHRKGLTVEQMVKAGVRLPQAEQAHAAVHTAAHEFAENQRRELIARLGAAGMSQDQLVKQLAGGIASRIGMAGGPGGAWAPSSVKPYGGPGSTTAAADLAAFLARTKTDAEDKKAKAEAAAAAKAKAEEEAKAKAKAIADSEAAPTQLAV